MNNQIFNISEIISIIMEEINCYEIKELYGIEEDINLSKPIEEKIKLLNSDSYENFYEIICDITEEVYPLKTGELNELNRCHEEIMILAQDRLNDYLVK